MLKNTLVINFLKSYFIKDFITIVPFQYFIMYIRINT